MFQINSDEPLDLRTSRRENDASTPITDKQMWSMMHLLDYSSVPQLNPSHLNPLHCSPPLPANWPNRADLHPAVHESSLLCSPPMSSSSSVDRNEVSMDKTTLSSMENYLTDNEKYIAFRGNVIRAMTEKNGGSLLGHNPRMRRSVGSTAPQQDDEYRQRRDRNNAAAKQSRDKRKQREINLSIKVAFLRLEVQRLEAELHAKVLCSRCNAKVRQLRADNGEHGRH